MAHDICIPVSTYNTQLFWCSWGYCRRIIWAAGCQKTWLGTWQEKNLQSTRDFCFLWCCWREQWTRLKRAGLLMCKIGKTTGRTKGRISAGRHFFLQFPQLPRPAAALLKGSGMFQGWEEKCVMWRQRQLTNVKEAVKLHRFKYLFPVLVNLLHRRIYNSHAAYANNDFVNLMLYSYINIISSRRTVFLWKTSLIWSLCLMLFKLNVILQFLQRA